MRCKISIENKRRLDWNKMNSTTEIWELKEEHSKFIGVHCTPSPFFSLFLFFLLSILLCLPLLRFSPSPWFFFLILFPCLYSSFHPFFFPSHSLPLFYTFLLPIIFLFLFSEKVTTWKSPRVLFRNQLCHNFNSGLPSLQNCEKQNIEIIPLYGSPIPSFLMASRKIDLSFRKSILLPMLWTFLTSALNYCLG